MFTKNVSSSSVHALHLLYRVGPLLTALCFCAGLALEFAFRLPPKPSRLQRKWRKAALWLSWLIVLTYVLELVLHAVRFLLEHGLSVARGRVAFDVASALCWSVSALTLIDFEFPRWTPYVASWCLGLVVEILVFTLSTSLYPDTGRFSGALWALASARPALFALIVPVGVVFLLPSRKKRSVPDEERQSLLACSLECQQSTIYGSTAEDAKDHGSRAKQGEEGLNDPQPQRFKDSGGLGAYLKNLAMLFPTVWTRQHWRIQLNLFGMILCCLAQRALNILIPHSMGILMDKLGEVYDTGRLPMNELAIWSGLRLLASRAAIPFAFSICSTISNQYLDREIIITVFKHILNLSMDFHTGKNSTGLIKEVDQGQSLISIVEELAFRVLPIAFDLVAAFFYIAHIFDENLALIVVVMAVAYVYTTIRLTTHNTDWRRDFIHQMLKKNTVMYDAISNWRTVTYFNRQAYEQSRLDKALREFGDSRVKSLLSSNKVFGIQDIIVQTATFAACEVAARRISGGTAGPGSFLAMFQTVSMLAIPLSSLANSYNVFSSKFIDAERMIQLLHTPPSVSTRPNAPDLKVEGCRVQFSNVSFAYDPRKPNLDKISFEAQAGQTIALVGETGSGKSTVLKLLMRLYDPTSGTIKIDGQDIRNVTLDSLREAVGIVPQDPEMFNKTIMENVRYARLKASDEEVYAACRAAAVHDKIQSFPEGYETLVGERGIKLSGGELQRIAIARIFLKDPAILLLDEATSAVDSVTESRIQNAFRHLSTGRTTFIVAHRLSTIMHANLILVLADGKIIEQGTQAELLRMGGTYADMWAKQTST